MIRAAVLSIVAALALAAAPTTARADWGCGYGGYGFCDYQALWGNPYVYSQGGSYIPPYFAIYPPVYYSPHIIARPYGWSPYAWPSTVMLPPGPPVYPAVIMNAHVKNADSKVAAAKSLPAKPQMIEGIQPQTIDNPFFVSK
ncbi:MAG: hypothetical protein L0211_02965 [Planctomycetaceae bacterium]|nr:hypothetical protein [Planctomycetaceae bacterium]